MLEKGFDAEVLTMLNSERNEVEYENQGKLQVNRFKHDNITFFNAKLFEHLIRNNYSLIHLHSINWDTNYLSWIASRLKKTPLVFTIHDPICLIPLMEPQSKASFWQKTRAIRNVKLARDSKTCVLVAFTNVQAASYKRLGIKNVKVIPHAVDTKVFENTPDNKMREKYGLDEFNILCVGVAQQRKGQRFLINSMPKILKEYPKTKLLLAGNTYFRSQTEYVFLKSLVNKLGLEEKVSFLNDVPKTDLIQLYLLSTLFALPTETEMFGIVFLEAMAAGLPIVATNKPYLQEIVGEAGILVDRQQDFIETAIMRLLGDQKLRNELGNAGKARVQKDYRLIWSSKNIGNCIIQYWIIDKRIKKTSDLGSEISRTSLINLTKTIACV